ncbi:MAG: cytidyltransferase [Pseudonocardiales bacterium]|nr:cytidyltransferase [Pseudonocardiales bacterium]
MTARIGYAPGVYDMFHNGHLDLLRQARAQCDFLVAGIISDEAALEARGEMPIVSAAERLQTVWGVDHVDCVIVDNAPSPFDAWERLRFKVLFKGDDWRGTRQGLALEAKLATVGAEIFYVPYSAFRSSRLRADVVMARG